MTEEGKPKRRRGGGFKPAGEATTRLLSPALRRRGFAQADILRHWPAIVGETLATQSRPERLWWPKSEVEADGATLHLLAAPGWAIEIQHMEPVILERVNRYFGWRAVTRMKLRQGAVTRAARPKPPVTRALTSEEKAELDRLLDQVTDPALRQRLMSLGSAIFARQ